MKGEKIIIELLSFSPSRIKKISSHSNLKEKSGICYYLKRDDLKDAKKIKELNKPAVYFFLGSKNKKAYIGRAEDFNKRMINHEMKKKDFWNEILVFTNKKSLLPYLNYLESLAVNKAGDLKNYSLENTQNIKDHSLTDDGTALFEEAKEFFTDTIEFFTSFLHFNLFEKSENIEKQEQKSEEKIEERKTEEENVWFCKLKGITAKGIYDGKNFVVLAGSQMIKEHSASLTVPSIRKRNSIIDNLEVVIDNKEEYVELKKNMELGSPSTAAKFCFGMSLNGWEVWKSKDGKTMNEVLRKN